MSDIQTRLPHIVADAWSFLVGNTSFLPKLIKICHHSSSLIFFVLEIESPERLAR